MEDLKNEQRNTLKLTNSFLDGMKEYGAIEEEYIHVSSKRYETLFRLFLLLDKNAGTIFPALLGIFTWWFQKWYPARKAAGK